MTGDITSTESPSIWIMDTPWISSQTGKRNGNKLGLISFPFRTNAISRHGFLWLWGRISNPVFVSFDSSQARAADNAVSTASAIEFRLFLCDTHRRQIFRERRISGMLLSPPEILNTDSDTALGHIRPLSGLPRRHGGWKRSSEVEGGNSAVAIVDLARQVE